MKYRCMRDDDNSEYVVIKTRNGDSGRHMSKQVGRVVPQGGKEKAVAESQSTNNPKGFRVYAPSHAHCVITSYGWIGQQSGSGFFDLAPSILHYNWF
jgi:hypothetical protein